MPVAIESNYWAKVDIFLESKLTGFILITQIWLTHLDYTTAITHKNEAFYLVWADFRKWYEISFFCMKIPILSQHCLLKKSSFPQIWRTLDWLKQTNKKDT